MTENIAEYRLIADAEKIGPVTLRPAGAGGFYKDLTLNTDAAVSGFFESIRNEFRGEVCVGLRAKEFFPEAVFFDMDATAVVEESLVELAILFGVKDEVAAITNDAMQGKMDYSESLLQRVALLKGCSEDLINEVVQSITPRQGLRDLTEELAERGTPYFLVTGGFNRFAEPLAHDFAFEGFRANELEMVKGCLSGRVLGEVVDAAAKAQWVHSVCENLAIEPEQVVCLGDGANDIEMMKVAGLGVGVQPKPALSNYIDCYVGNGDLEFVKKFLFT